MNCTHWGWILWHTVCLVTWLPFLYIPFYNKTVPSVSGLPCVLYIKSLIDYYVFMKYFRFIASQDYYIYICFQALWRANCSRMSRSQSQNSLQFLALWEKKFEGMSDILSHNLKGLLEATKYFLLQVLCEQIYPNRCTQ